MKTKNALAAAALMSCLWLSSALAANWTSATGFVTPTSMTFTITALNLNSAVDGSQTTIWTGSKTVTFARSDANFATASLGSAASVPNGRYTGLSISLSTNVTATINGNKYTGITGNGISTGTPIFSVGTTGTTAGSIATSGTAIAMSGLFPSSVTGTPGSTTFFPKVLCINTDTTQCKSTDQAVNPTGQALTITLISDLFHALVVDTAAPAVAFGNGAYPYAVFGGASAAVHLEVTSGTDVADATMLFDGSKNLLGLALNASGGINFRNGWPYVTVTTAPFTLPSAGNTANMAFVAKLDATGTGTLQFPVTSASTSRGLIT
ncbi:MAG: hypothetical protein ACXWPM_12175, partial [Bdellovibrionota bacterium]